MQEYKRGEWRRSNLPFCAENNDDDDFRTMVEIVVARKRKNEEEEIVDERTVISVVEHLSAMLGCESGFDENEDYSSADISVFEEKWIITGND